MPGINPEKVEQLYNERLDRFGDKHAMLDAHPEWKRANEFHHYVSLRVVQEILQPIRNKVILDYGCGIGRLCIPLSKKAKFVYGADTNAAAIQKAKQAAANIPNIRFTAIKNLNELTSDKPLDLVFTYGVLCHMNEEDILELLKFLKPKLAPNARVLLIEPVEHAEKPYISDILIRRTAGEWKALFSQSSFDVIQQRMLLRWPSYARHYWNLWRFLPHFTLPLFYKLEKATLHRKPQFIEYSFDAFELKAK